MHVPLHAQHNKEREELHRLQAKHPELAAKLVRRSPFPPPRQFCSYSTTPGVVVSAWRGVSMDDRPPTTTKAEHITGRHRH